MSPSSLAGLRVLLTRPEGDGADDWVAAFEAKGAVPVVYPTIARVPPASWNEVDAAIGRLHTYDWLVFASQTAVLFLLERLPGKRFPSPLRARIAAVGAKTARAIESGGGRVELVPADQRQEGLALALAGLPPQTKVLLPAAADGRALLAERLRSRGCAVDVVTVYQTRPRTDWPPVPAFDVATFASPSALRAFLAGPGKLALARKPVAVIGPTTAEEARMHGLLPRVARSPSVEELIRAVADSGLTKGES